MTTVIKTLCHKSRNSRWRCSIKKGVLKNFAKFAGKHLCHSLFFNKLAGFRPGILLKKRLWHKCIPVNFRKFLWTPFLQNTFGRLSIVIRELQTVFWKLRLEITNFLENCVSSFFWWLNNFSFRTGLHALRTSWSNTQINQVPRQTTHLNSNKT